MEGEPKLPVEDRVDDGVERRVAVAEPEDDAEQLGGDGDAGEEGDGVDGEEGKPAPDEGRHHYAEDEGGTPLLGSR